MSTPRLDGRVLVIVYGHVADTMAAIPALRALRRAAPEARIEVLCLRSVAPILELCPYVDELLLWGDFARKAGRGARVEKATVLAVLAARLRARRYRAVLVLHRSATALRRLARATGSPLVVGVSDGDDGYTHPVPPSAIESSRSENRRVLAALGVVEDGGPVELWTTEADQAQADSLLGEATSAVRPLVGLHPGSDWSCQQWLPERFAEVGRMLHDRIGAAVAVTGAPSEVALESEVADALGFEPVRLAGRTSLRQLVAVIARLDVLVCVNSAAAAIARAVGTPAVVLLGPEDARLTGLAASNTVRVVQTAPAAPGSWCELGRWGFLSGCESPMCRGLGGLATVSAASVAAQALELVGAGPSVEPAGSGRWGR